MGLNLIGWLHCTISIRLLVDLSLTLAQIANPDLPRPIDLFDDIFLWVWPEILKYVVALGGVVLFTAFLRSFNA